MRNKALLATALAAVLSASPLVQAQVNDGASQGPTNVYLQLQ